MLPVLVIRSAAALGAHHTRPDGGFRRARSAEERAFRGDLYPAEDIAAGTELGFFSVRKRGLKLYVRIKRRIFIPEA